MKKMYHKLLMSFIVTLVVLPFVITFILVTSNENLMIRLIRLAAEKGNAIAQYNLAVAYDSGEGVKQDKKQALFWYHKSADQEHLNAMFNLAICYDKGEGTETNKIIALFWYTKGAEAGDTDAQNNLAVMYRDGDGTPVDYIKALKWFWAAATQKNSLAQYNLGEFYYFGRGDIPANKIQSYAWFAVAAKSGTSNAAYYAVAAFNALEPNDRDAARALANHYITAYAK